MFAERVTLGVFESTEFVESFLEVDFTKLPAFTIKPPLTGAGEF